MSAISEPDVAAENKKDALKTPRGIANRIWPDLENPNSERARAKALFESQYIKLHELRKNA
jgi:hypothetical protein